MQERAVANIEKIKHALLASSLPFFLSFFCDLQERKNRWIKVEKKENNKN